MTELNQKNTKKPTKSEEHAKRAASALRDNLRRRKQQGSESKDGARKD